MTAPRVAPATLAAPYQPGLTISGIALEAGRMWRPTLQPNPQDGSWWQPTPRPTAQEDGARTDVTTDTAPDTGRPRRYRGDRKLQVWRASLVALFALNLAAALTTLVMSPAVGR